MVADPGKLEDAKAKTLAGLKLPRPHIACRAALWYNESLIIAPAMLQTPRGRINLFGGLSMLTVSPCPKNGNIPQKRCPRCNRLLPLTAQFFHLRVDAKGGFTSHCKECRNSYQRNQRREGKLPEPPEGYKRCSHCNKIKPATTEFFARQKAVKAGLRSYCKACSAQNHQNYISQPGIKETIQKRGQIYLGKPGVKERRQKWSQVWAATTKGRASRLIAKHTRRAHKLAATGKHTLQEIEQQYKRQKGKCYYCHKNVAWEEKHVEHVIPLSRGGSDDISNLVISCSFCNQSKNDRLPSEWPQGGRLL